MQSYKLSKESGIRQLDVIESLLNVANLHALSDRKSSWEKNNKKQNKNKTKTKQKQKQNKNKTKTKQKQNKNKTKTKQKQNKNKTKTKVVSFPFVFGVLSVCFCVFLCVFVCFWCVFGVFFV